MVFKWEWKNAAAEKHGELDEKDIVGVSDTADNGRLINESNGIVAAKETKEIPTPITENDSRSNVGIPLGSSRPKRTCATKNVKKYVEADSSDLNDLQLPSASIGSKPKAGRRSYQFSVMYAKLVAFQKEKGHCCVPQNYPEDRQLAAWVKNLRRYRKPGHVMSEDHIRQLDAIGFLWKSRAGRPIGATIEAGAKCPARKFRKPYQLDED
jgi:Helicase associated domain